MTEMLVCLQAWFLSPENVFSGVSFSPFYKAERERENQGKGEEWQKEEKLTSPSS